MTRNLYPGFPVGVSQRLRFCIEALDGRRSGLWSLWRSGSKDDVYLAARGVAGILKVSLHASGTWRWGFTDNYATEAARRGFIAPGTDRAKHKWKRPPSSEGWTHATTVYFPARDATVPKVLPDKRPTFVLVAPPKDHVVALHVWMVEPTAEPSFPGKRPEHAVIAGIPLPSGGAVVVTAEQTLMTAAQHRAIDVAVLQAASITPAAALETEDPEQVRLALFLSDDATGAARFIDLGARGRLEVAWRHLSR